MVRRYLPLLALGLGAWLAFFISQFPASTALRWFAPEVLRTSNVSGTIWSGSAQLASVGELPMRDLRWQIRPLSLLLARLAGSVEATLANGFANAEFSVTAARASLENVQLSTSLSTFAGMLPISGATGALSARLDSLELERDCPISASGDIRISELSVEIMTFTSTTRPLVSLGGYEIALSSADGSGIRGVISDLGSGPLEVQAGLDLTPACVYTIEARVRERPSTPEALLIGLRAMASEPGPDGWRMLELTGSF